MCEEIARMIGEGCPNVDDADEQAYSEQMHRENDLHYLTEDDLLGCWDDNDHRDALCDWCGDEHEPTDDDVCEWCGASPRCH